MQLDYQEGCISYCFSLSVRCLGFACVPFPHHVPLPWLSHWPPRGVHYDFGDFPADRTGSIGRGRQLQVLQRRLHRVTVVAVNSLLLSLVFQRSISWFLASHLNRDDIWSKHLVKMTKEMWRAHRYKKELTSMKQCCEARVGELPKEK